MTIRRYLIVFAMLSGAASAAAQDKDKLVVIGELVFYACQSCHFVGDKKLEKVGPHLNDLFGRKPGGLPEYSYSLAMARFGKDHVWDGATLTKFLHDPGALVTGTNMKFPGLKKDEEVQALLAFWQLLTPMGWHQNNEQSVRR